jgi:hypothetical protein
MEIELPHNGSGRSRHFGQRMSGRSEPNSKLTDASGILRCSIWPSTGSFDAAMSSD